jgi:pimeloyl-ACP methyl ester carboxylesterase
MFLVRLYTQSHQKAHVHPGRYETGFHYFEIGLGKGPPLFGSKSVPLDGSLIVLGNTVGASMGGRVSLVAIGEGKIDAAALLLVDMAPRIEPEGRRKIQEFMDQNPGGLDTLEEVAEAISNYQPHRKRPRNLDGLAKNVRLGADGKYHWHWDPVRRANWRYDTGYRDRLSDCADNLTLPTLLVLGGLSDVLSEAGAQSFLAQCPLAEYVNVENAAHMVAGDRNDIFAGSVIEFLQRAAPVMSAA